VEEKKKEEAGFFKPVDYSTIGVKLKHGSIKQDFLERVEQEKPNLIAFTIFSSTKNAGYDLAKTVKETFAHIPTIFGGIHVNIDPEEVLNKRFVDYICLGEGEQAIVEFAENLHRGKDVSAVRNIGLKKNGRQIINPVRAPQNLDDLPFMDWDLFDSYQIYGPYRGNLLRMALVEFSRTCPYRCTYCGNRVFHKYYSQSGFELRYRTKSPRRWIEELKHIRNTYDPEIISIIDGTFVAQKEESLTEICELYKKEINLPFFCDSTVHCLTERKAVLLKEMGCVCVNMGIESANEEYRKKYMDRTMTNRKIKSTFLMAREVGLDTRAYCIIGLPFETEENIVETIAFLRECNVGSVSLNIFMPYPGTKLREVCIKEKLFDPNTQEHLLAENDGTRPIIKNPYLSEEELMKLYNSFILYVMAPREVYPVIRLAEHDTPFARRLRQELMSIYT